MESWSDLPIDIIRMILERLHYSDGVSFGAVCKSWWRALNVYGGVKYADKLPWLFAYDCETSRIARSHYGLCYLYDPYNKRKRTIERQDLVGATILASKDGWILLSDLDTGSILFYSPFTDKIVNLPSVDIYLGLYKATFSGCPTSPDCVVFVVSVAFRLRISICSPGKAAEWKHRYGDEPVRFIDLHGVAYMDGCLYCAFSSFLWAFNPENGKFYKIRHNPIGTNCYPGLNSDGSCLIESDGNLFMIYDKKKNRKKCNLDPCTVLRFDYDERKWLEIEDLGNKMLFVGYGSHSSILIAAGDADEGDLANTVHFVKELVCFDPWYWQPGFSKYFDKKRRHDRDSCPQPYAWIEELVWKRNIWLQPPQFREDTTNTTTRFLS